MASERDKVSTSSESQSEGLRGNKCESKLDLRSSDDLRSRKLDRNQAKKIAAEILSEGSISYTGHCKQELKNDKMDTVDVINILRCGRIGREPEPAEKFGAWRYRVETHKMAVIIEIHSTSHVRVITAWRNKL
jgi:protein-tyrosine-phosphatase